MPWPDRRALAGLALLWSASATAEPPPAFDTCLGCHIVEGRGSGMPGPSLAGLFGRPVAGSQDFDYSPALQAARAHGLVWDADLLDRYLTDGQAVFPGNWMALDVRDAADRAAIIAYLADR